MLRSLTNQQIKMNLKRSLILHTFLIRSITRTY